MIMITFIVFSTYDILTMEWRKTYYADNIIYQKENITKFLKAVRADNRTSTKALVITHEITTLNVES